MQTIQKWQARDGAEFNSEEKCLAYEALLSQCESIMAPFGTRPRDAEFANGSGFIQHDLSDFTHAKGELVKLLAERAPMYDYTSHDPATIHPMSIVGRIFDDTGGPMSKAWSRLACFDPQGREWGQPYFALNPEKGTQRPIVT